MSKTKTPSDAYKYTDKVTAYLMKQYVREFGKAGNLQRFDELNVIGWSKKLYEKLDKLTREAYLLLANKAYKDSLKAYLPPALSPEKEGEELAEAWLAGLLTEYDPITRYVYTHEWERKRARYAESVIASKQPKQEADTALHLLARQAKQYAVNVTDAAAVEAYKKAGIKKVRWISEDDEKVCSVCGKRHNKVYYINKVPPKPHYNCRCWLVPEEE